MAFLPDPSQARHPPQRARGDLGPGAAVGGPAISGLEARLPPGDRVSLAWPGQAKCREGKGRADLDL